MVCAQVSGYPTAFYAALFLDFFVCTISRPESLIQRSSLANANMTQSHVVSIGPLLNRKPINALPIGRHLCVFNVLIPLDVGLELYE